jgi:hypothetical protein
VSRLYPSRAVTFFSYWFWPNPGGWYYTDPKVMAILAACAALVVLSFAINFWRRGLQNAITKKLSVGWSRAAFWFGLTGAFLAACRVEGIQFLAMRAVFALWILSGILYVVFQIVNFRRRHYTVLERTQVVDERDKYLPRRK